MDSDSGITVSVVSDALSVRLIDSDSDTVLVPLLETVSVNDTFSDNEMKLSTSDKTYNAILIDSETETIQITH